MPETEPTLSSRLSALLRRHGLSMAEVAHSAGMSKQQVHEIVSGKVANPGVLTITRIVEAAGATMAEFYRDE